MGVGLMVGNIFGGFGVGFVEVRPARTVNPVG